jgi:serine/threonine protein kinase
VDFSEARMQFPHQVGKIVLQKYLHSTGICDSYSATEISPSSNSLLVRRLNPQIPKDGAFRQLLDARVTRFQSVTHPNFTRTYNIFDEENAVWLSESVPQGMSLESAKKAALAAGLNIPNALFLHIAISVCEALDALHQTVTESGDPLLHLALYPDNIFVTDSGEVTIAHFGVSKNPIAIAKNFSGHHTLQHIHHLSPELTQAENHLSAGSDIFCAASTLYELLMGTPLFLSQTTIETLHNVRRVDIATELQHVQSRLPGLEKVLARALAPDAQHRYGRAFAMREDLRALLVSYDMSSIPELASTFFKDIGINKPAPLKAIPEREIPTEEFLRAPPIRVMAQQPNEEVEETLTDVGPSDITVPLRRNSTAPSASLDATDSMIRPHRISQEQTSNETSFDETIPTFSTGFSKATLKVGGALLLSVVILGWVFLSPNETTPPPSVAVDTTPPPLVEEQDPLPTAAPEVVNQPTSAQPIEAKPQRRSTSSPTPQATVPRSEPTTISPDEIEKPVYEEPVYEEPTYEEPVYEEPIYEEPVYEEPIYEEPIYEEPVNEEPVATVEVGSTLTIDDLSSLRDKAQRGALTDSERIILIQIPLGIPEYTVARSYLFDDAKARGDNKGKAKHISAILALPENQYSPVFLIEDGILAITNKDYSTALLRANLAERHWQRMPSDLIFSRKIMIYETQAKAWYGIHVKSEGDDVDALRASIRAWNTYKRHVGTKSRLDLVKRADGQIKKLEANLRRLE